MLKQITSRTGSLIAGSALAAAALITTAAPATAGTNGQQMAISTRYSDVVQMCGNNQNGVRVCTGWISTPNYWTKVYGWWWKGEVEFWGIQYDGPGGYEVHRYSYCNVPASQADDWTWCDEAGDL